MTSLPLIEMVALFVFGYHLDLILGAFAFLDGIGLAPGHGQQVTTGYITLDRKPTSALTKTA